MAGRAGVVPRHRAVSHADGDRAAGARGGAARGRRRGQPSRPAPLVLRPARLPGGGAARRQSDVRDRPVFRGPRAQGAPLVVGVSHRGTRAEDRGTPQAARHQSLFRGPVPRRPAQPLLPHGRDAAGEIPLVSPRRLHLCHGGDRGRLRAGLPLRRGHRGADPDGGAGPDAPRARGRDDRPGRAHVFLVPAAADGDARQ